MHDTSLTIESLTTGIDAPDDVLGFFHTPGTRVVFGVGAVDRLGSVVRAHADGTVLVVTDAGIRSAGHVDRVLEVLAGSGIEAAVFDAVHENPTTDDVAACVAFAREAEARIIVGLGGGSSMDTAKGCNFILTNGGEMKDYWGVGKAHCDMLPLIAVPTTAGTGSECQSFALIADADSNRKMACGDRRAAARVALLDPELTLTQPRSVTAHTGIDAIAHAIETCVTRERTPVSSAYSRVAFRLLAEAFERVLAEPDDLRARGAMLLGAAYAGTAIENSMLGAAHAAANPLTARFDVIHGEAVGIMLPHVVRFNRDGDAAARAAYATLGVDGDLARRVEHLLEQAGMANPLSRHGVTEADIAALAEDAAAQWTAQFNPVSAGLEEFAALYRAAL